MERSGVRTRSFGSGINAEVRLATGLGLLGSALLAMVGCRNVAPPRTEQPEAVERHVGKLVGVWTAQDVGAVAAAGTWNESNGTHTIEGSGADIWNTADEFR